MEAVSQVQLGRRQNRGFVLGSLSFGHGISHMFDQGFPILMREIAASMALGTVATASIFAVRQAGSSLTSLGGGPVVDMLKRQWGLILTWCMLLHAITYVVVGAAPTFAVVVLIALFVSMPGSLWHLPSAAALSQRFPDRRGFAISMQGFGSNIGNVLGPVIAGALLVGGVLMWRHVFFIYAALALAMAALVWWSLKDLGKEGEPEDAAQKTQGTGELRARFLNAIPLLKNPIVVSLILAALLRGIGLNALFNWTPFYLRDTLGKSTLEAGIFYALITGMGIVSAPVLGALSDKFSRKVILVPGFLIAAALSMTVVSVGNSWLLIPVFAGMGLFSYSLHQIIQASVLDVVGRGTEATAIGLLFGINGVIGAGTPFLAALIIDHLGGQLGGYGVIYYYTGILTALTAVIILFIPLRSHRVSSPAPAAP